jgi:hypothetical protein
LKNFELLTIPEVCLDVCNALCCGQVLIGLDKLAPALADCPFSFPFPQISPHLTPSQTSHLLHHSINPKLNLQMPIIPREIILEDWSLPQIVATAVLTGLFSGLLFCVVAGYLLPDLDCFECWED